MPGGYPFRKIVVSESNAKKRRRKKKRERKKKEMSIPAIENEKISSRDPLDEDFTVFTEEDDIS